MLFHLSSAKGPEYSKEVEALTSSYNRWKQEYTRDPCWAVKEIQTSENTRQSQNAGHSQISHNQSVDAGVTGYKGLWRCGEQLQDHYLKLH